MAEQENILTRLGKLFQNQIILRQTPSGQIKVKDVDFTQTALTSNFIDRYNRLMHGSNWAAKYAAAKNQRSNKGFGISSRKNARKLAKNKGTGTKILFLFIDSNKFFTISLKVICSGPIHSTV